MRSPRDWEIKFREGAGLETHTTAGPETGATGPNCEITRVVG
jgi:hypothetical protein